MQNERYTSNRQNTLCAWCIADYTVGTSRAKDNAFFCSKKCEIEAHFWLHGELTEIEIARKSDPSTLS